MSQLDALRLSENLRRRMVDFAMDDNFVRDSELSDICRSIWGGPPSEGGLISDLWVEGAFPSKSSPHSLDSLVSEGSSTLTCAMSWTNRRRCQGTAGYTLTSMKRLRGRGPTPAVDVLPS